MGACSFIIACFHATANAPFGSSFCFRQNILLARHPRHTGAAIALAAKGAAGLIGGEVVKVVLGRGCFWEIALLLLLRFCLVNCFARLLAALARFAALVPFPVWVLRLNRIPRLLSVWFIASRGHHFALGTGGLKLSLLVGGLGPVYSLPKYCFKPFRIWKGKPFSLQASLAPVLKNFSQLTALKQISLLASWVFPVLPPLKIWQGATFSKGCHKEFGCSVKLPFQGLQSSSPCWWWWW